MMRNTILIRLGKRSALKFWIRQWQLAFGTALLLGQLGFAQGTASNDSTSIKEVIANNSAAELLIRATKDQAFIKGLELKLLSKDEIEGIKETVSKRKAELESFYVKEKKDVFVKTDFRAIEKKRRKWVQESTSTNGLIELLSADADLLEKNKTQLINKAQFWDKVLKDYPLHRINLTLKSKVRSILQADKKLRTPYNHQLNALLEQINILAVEKILLEAEINRLTYETGFHKTRLLALDHYNIFTHFSKMAEEQPILENLQNSWLSIQYEFKGFGDHFSGQIFIQIFATLLLTFFVFLIKKQIKNDDFESDHMLSYASNIFRYPILLSLIIAVIFANYNFYDAPPIFVDILGLIIVFPFVVVAPKMMYRPFRPYVYLMVGLWLLIEISEVISSFSLIGRLIMLFVQLVSLLALAKIAWWDKLHLSFKTNLLKTSFILFHGLMMSILGLSVLANIVGNVGMSDLFTSSIIKSVIYSICIFTWILVLKSLIYVIIRSEFIQSRKLFKTYKVDIRDFLLQLATIYGVVYWALVILGAFNIKTQVIDWLEGTFMYSFAIGDMELSLWNTSAFFFILWFSSLIAKVIRVVLEDEVLNRFKLARGLPGTISMLVRYALVTIGFFVAISAAGFELSQLSILFGAFGVGIGFGLQNIFNNLVSGLILAFERPIKLGDTVEVGTLIGTVKNIGIRSSNVHTLQGAEVIVPNGNLISNEVINWTLSDKKRRIEVLVGIAYGSDVHFAAKLFSDILKKHEEVLQYPSPNVYFQGFGDSSLDFRLHFWTKDFNDWLRIKSEIVFQVHDALYDNNIEIPFPQRDLHVRSVGDQVGKILGPNQPPKD